MKTVATKDARSAPAVHKVNPYVHHPMDPVQQAHQAMLRKILHPAEIQTKQDNENEEEAVQEKPVQREPENDEEESAQAKLIQRQPEDEEEEPIQAKLLQRQPDNEEEEEAVQSKPLADQITPLVQRQEEPPEEEQEPVQTKLSQRQPEQNEEEPAQAKLMQRQSEGEEEVPVQAKLIQREEEEEEPTQAKLVQRQSEGEEEEPVQTKIIQREEEEEEPAQAKLMQRQSEGEEEEPVQTKLIQREEEEEEEEEPAQGKLIQRQMADMRHIQPSRIGYFGPKQHAQQSEIRRILHSTSAQAKLTIGKPNDKYEQEADRVADQVMSMPDRKLQSQPENDEEEETVQSKPLADQITPLVQRQEEPPEEEEPAQAKLIQRQSEEEEEGPIQAKLIQRQSDNEEEEPVQTRLIQREEEADEPVQTKEMLPYRTPESDNQLDSKLKNSQGNGDSLSPDIRTPMERNFGADFSGVRIHTDSNSVQMSKTLHAQAFTYGQHIHFNEGKFSPGANQGKHLLAHELTHTIQQGASPSIKNKEAATHVNASHVQGGFIGNKLNKYARHVPGWDLMTVIIGKNPLTGKTVVRNAKNFLGGVIGVLPGGRALYDKLLEHGLVDSAFTWFKKKLSDLNLSWTRVKDTASAAWDDMDFIRLDPFDYNLAVLKRHFLPLWEDVKTFASAVAKKVVALVKAALVTPLVSFIKERTRAYPLLTVILGNDPITGKKVDRSLYNIVAGFLMLTESGEKYLAKLKESGTLQKLSKWMNAEIDKLNLGPKVIKKTFSDAWNAISIKSVIEPIKAFKKLYNIFAAPAKRIFRFVVNVAKKVLSVIKDWLIGKLKAYAHKIPGYPLLTVILRRDLVTGKSVPRTAKNFIRGFMSLVPGGLKKYDDLEKSGAIDRAFAWLSKAVIKLNLSWKILVGLFKQAWASLSINDLVKPIAAFQRIVAIFKPPVFSIFRFVGAVALKIAEFIFIGVMGPTGERVLKILKKAKSTFILIIKDPIGFASNLLSAVGKGFQQFSGNIWKHLKAGLIGWLMGALSGAGLQLPEKFDLKGIIDLVLQVLGITYARIRVKLVKHLGEGVVSKLEKVFSFIKILVTEGPAGAWKKIMEYVGNLKDMVLGAIKDWVVTKIITAAVTKIASMLNPVGAVIQAILSVYNTIMFFVERINQILDLVKAVTNSIASIVAGKIGAAANYVEQTMARTIPVIISFLARLIGLGGVSEAIMKVIKKIQAKVVMAIDKVVGFIVKKAKKLFGKVKSAAGKLVSWWKQKKIFKTKSGETHSIFFEGKGKSSTFMIASKKQTIETYLNKINLPTGDPRIPKLAIAKKLANQIEVITRSAVTTKEAKDITNIMTDLSKLLVELDAKSITNVPATPKWKPGGGKGIGKHSDVTELSTKSAKDTGRPTGTTPEYSNLQTRGLTDKAEWVRMHLISAKVGSPGSSQYWVPAPRKVNSGSKVTSFETSMKNLLTKKTTKNLPNVVWAHSEVTDVHPAKPQWNNLPDFPKKVTFRSGLHFIKGGNWEKDVTARISEDVVVDEPIGGKVPTLSDPSHTALSRLDKAYSLGGVFTSTTVKRIKQEALNNSPYASRASFIKRIKNIKLSTAEDIKWQAKIPLIKAAVDTLYNAGSIRLR